MSEEEKTTIFSKESLSELMKQIADRMDKETFAEIMRDIGTSTLSSASAIEPTRPVRVTLPEVKFPELPATFVLPRRSGKSLLRPATKPPEKETITGKEATIIIYDEQGEIEEASKMAEEANIVIETFLKALEAMSASKPAFTLKAPVSTSVKMADGRYKTSPLTGSEEFQLIGMRAGKRDDYILEFAPLDARPYVQMEMNARKAIDSFGPDFEAQIVAMIGGKEGQTWGRAAGELVRKTRKELETENESRLRSTYANNPNWGLF